MSWLLDTAHFITRDRCGSGWTDMLIAVNRLSNLLIALAYFLIPLALFALWLNVRRLVVVREIVGSNPSIILCFVVFIMSCGLTHLCDVSAFEWAPYRLFTVIDVVTAVSSLFTAMLLPGVVKQVLTQYVWKSADGSLHNCED